MTPRQDTAQGALALLPLNIAALSEQQRRGAACVYDGTPLGVNAVNLGSRPHNGITVFPRACILCIPRIAEKTLTDHRAHCEECVEIDVPCDTREALHTLARQHRPHHPIAYCNWHGGLADTCLPVQAVEQDPSHGADSLYACTRCRQMHHLTPLTEHP